MKYLSTVLYVCFLLATLSSAFRLPFARRESASSSSSSFSLLPQSNEQYSNPQTRVAKSSLRLYAQKEGAGLDSIEWNAMKRRKTSLKQLAAAFRKSYDAREWFVTGMVDPR